MTAERDLLLVDKAMADERFNKTSAAIDAIGEIVSDPGAYGTEDEVLELLGGYFAPGATTHDLAYEEIDTIEGWRTNCFAGRSMLSPKSGTTEFARMEARPDRCGLGKASTTSASLSS